jgi:putative ABC transport system permease protein
MGILELIRVSLRAILINKTRAVLTMLGIIIGVASVIVMLAIGESTKTGITSNISGMGSNLIMISPKAKEQVGLRSDVNSLQSLIINDYTTIKSNVSLVRLVSPIVTGSGQIIYGSNNWKATLYGVAPEYTDIRSLQVEEGSMFTEYDVRTSSKVAVLGRTVVDNLFPYGPNPIGQTVRFNNIPFKVVGILETKGMSTFGQDQDDIVLSPYTTVQKRILGITYLHSIYGSAVKEEKAEEAALNITNLLAENHKISSKDNYDFEVSSQKELIETFSSITEMLTLLLVTIASISLVVGGIGIMNIMYVSVKERTREVGLRLAVGGRGVDILRQFLMESVFISFTGVIIGIVIGTLVSFLIGAILGWQVVIPPISVVISFGVCTLTGVFFGWYPAKKAAGMDPIQALRYE